MPNVIDRRQHERFRVDPGYSPIAVRTHDDTEFRFEGHAYDLSEGGVRFELDRPIQPGTTISMRIDLPDSAFQAGDIGPGRAVFITGNVVWCDADEPGACQMAVAITRFDRAGDKERLLRRLSTARHLFLRAA
jgi:hypothetical protein